MRTPGPWKLCSCGCGTISGEHYPIAKVEKGEWGDTYPAIRLISSTIEGKYEAYMEKIGYGTIPEEVSEANARSIVTACNCYEKLVAALEEIKKTIPAYVCNDRFAEEFNKIYDIVDAALAKVKEAP